MRVVEHRGARGRGASRDRARRLLRGAIALAMLSCLAVPAQGQTLVESRQDLDSDRPEAWAMAYFGSLGIMTRLTEPFELAPGEWQASLEGDWVPRLSEEERRVGFGGSKVEDLNRSPVLGRLRGAVGLPGGWVLGLGWVPPVELDDAEANLYSASLGRSLRRSDRWLAGFRLSATAGEIRGDFTCDRATVAAGDDPERNPFGCLEPSRDEMDLGVATFELTVAREGSEGRWRSSAGILGSYFDNEFQVNARYGEVIDRSLLESQQWTGAASVGLSRLFRSPFRIGGELFYSPLRVDRGTGTETDGLFHARVQVSYGPRGRG